MRDQLRKSAQETLQAARDGITWINDPKNAGRVSTDRSSAEKTLRKHVVETRRALDAIDRPMCVSVFGPSQAGKSYLIASLCRKDGSPTMVKFVGHPDVDVLVEINPDGDKESTGLVTRFSIKPIDTPPGFPVALRLLSEADIVKIIGNSFFLDGDQKRETPLDPERVEAVLSEAEKAVVAGQPADNRLAEEDIWGIQEYFEKQFNGTQLIVPMRAIWDRFSRMAPHLGMVDRAKVFALLWGEHAALTRLYLDFVGALNKLGFSATAYAPMTALRPKQKSIIDVQTLKGLDGHDGDLLTLHSGGGMEAAFPRAIVTAITAEIYLQLAQSPYDFFEHTDLLDFPGARERQKFDLKEFLADASEGKFPLMELIRRGKVAYLFDNYSATQEVTSMLLCVEASNQNVVTLPEMISNWISISHGPEPENRVGAPVVLFFVLTKFDLHFNEKAGEIQSEPGERFKSRMHASLLDFFGKDPRAKWLRHWTPNQPFKNCFWLRNPSYKSEHLFSYDGMRELAVLPGKVERIRELREGYLHVPDVQAHFADPARAFDEAMKLNDGGLSYLAQNLGPVCRPDIKLGQIAARLGILGGQIHDRLSHFYIDTDISKRLDEARQKAREIFNSVKAIYGAHQFGMLTRSLQVDAQDMAPNLYRYISEPSGKAASAPGGKPESADLNPLDDLLDIFGDSEPTVPLVTPARPAARAETSNGGREHDLAAAAIRFWSDQLHNDCDNGKFTRVFGLPSPHAARLVEELTFAARRVGVRDQIVARLATLSGSANESVEFVVERAAIVATDRINRFVNSFGFDEIEESSRPQVKSAAGTRPVFVPRKVEYSIDTLPDAREDFGAKFAADWLLAFVRSVETNVTSEGSLTIDIEQNTRLGAILKKLEAAPR